MARKSHDIRRIESRRKAIAERMENLEYEIERLRTEDTELQTAERVLRRLAELPEAGDDEDSATPGDDDELKVRDGNEDEGLGTIGDMALSIIRERAEVGATSNELLVEIQRRWLPQLMRTSLSPPLSRLKRKGVIQQIGEHWCIVKENGASTAVDAPEAGGSSAVATPEHSIPATPISPTG